MMQLGLIGYPLGHSLSPKIHLAALEACGLQGDYALFPIQPDDPRGLRELLARLRCDEIQGINVTIPHKQNIIPLLDELTSTAEAIGAVNTVWMQNGKLIGENTDASGFLADLKRFLTTETRGHPSPTGNTGAGGDSKLALVLGAGGAARAVVHALINDGWEVIITARRLSQAQALVSQFPKSDAQISSIAYSPTALHSFLPVLSLIVNTTPLGMFPNIDKSPWPDDLHFPRNAVIYDLVYNPRETELVRDAQAAGLPVTTGLGMLIEQAALSFEIWTGCNPPRKAIWNTLES